MEAQGGNWDHQSTYSKSTYSNNGIIVQCYRKVTSMETKRRPGLTFNGLKSLPEVTHGVANDDVARATVDQVVIHMSIPLVENLGLPQVFVDQLVDAGHQHGL